MSSPKGMVLVRGGSFVMGSMDFYPEERPLRPAEAGDLWFDEHPVTNAQFRRFVRDSGHVTVAEQSSRSRGFPGRGSRRPGSRLAAVRGHDRSGAIGQLDAVVDMGARSELASPGGSGQHAARP